MFERFTDRARRVVVLAQEEARMLNHNYIGTEHILLGLIREGEGVAAQVLVKLGADLNTVNGKILIYQSKITGRVSTVNGDITVGSGSHIHGGILVDKTSGISWGKQKTPRILIGPNAIVMGELIFKRPVELLVHSTAKIGKVIGANVQTYTDKPPARKD